MVKSSGDDRLSHQEPTLLPTRTEFDVRADLRLESQNERVPDGTLGALRLATRVSGPAEFPPVILVQPFDGSALHGLDPASIRVFRWNEDRPHPIWNSGINTELGFIWAKIGRPGLYVPIGLPRDRLVQEAIRTAARQRRLSDAGSAMSDERITRAAFALILEAAPEDIEALRQLLASLEVKSSRAQFLPGDVRPGRGGHLLPFPLPGGVGLLEFRERISRLKAPPGGLPEEALFDNPEILPPPDAPWPQGPGAVSLYDRVEQASIDRLKIWDWLRSRDLPGPFHFPHFPWFFSPDWWMYHHDVRHSGHASGWSGITSTSAHRLYLYAAVHLNDGGRIISIPSIVNGKAYVGTIAASGGGGNLFRIDLAAGAVDAPPYHTASGTGYYDGIGGSPAVTSGRLYFTDIPGRVYCIDANTFALLWKTDLRNQDLGQDQPVTNPAADCWSGPVVANGNVYVGCGEGESGAFGFVYCLDAWTGKVKWLFCTDLFPGVANNSPNVIPQSAAGGLSVAALAALGPGFTTGPNPPTGASVWSSCAYDYVLNRISVGTGNSEGPAPAGAIDARYGSGVLSLDASTGTFQGFFQPDPADSYHPGDSDIDVSSSPTIFWRGPTRALAIGSKSGAFFVLDANTMTPLTTPRNLLPKTGGDGFRGDGSAPLATVDPGGAGGGENMYGIFGTAAVHYGLGYLYVGMGGYGHYTATGYVSAIDYQSTPFLRAVRWDTLADAWTTVLGADGVKRYAVPKPPMYTNPGEAGLSSPAVVNDVVFVSTSIRRFYALDAATGLCLWQAPGIVGGPLSWDTCIMGPAVSGNWVVIGSEDTVYIYTLRPAWPWPWPWPWPLPWPWPRPWPPPPPPPPWTEQAGRRHILGGGSS